MSRNLGVGYQSNQSSPQVRVSFVSLQAGQQQQQQLVASPVAAGGGGGINGQDVSSISNSVAGGCGAQDRICFNIGKELYVYSFKGIRRVSFCLHFLQLKFIFVCNLCNRGVLFSFSLKPNINE